MILISFESIEGAGKTTQIAKLLEYFQSLGKKVITTKEPTNNPIGNMLRQSLSSGIIVSTTTEVMLFMANRSYHVDSLLSKVSDDTIVLTDRYIDSSVVYQSIIKGFDRQFIDDLNNVVTQDGKFTPDLTFVLDIDPVLTMKRLKSRKVLEKNDKETYDFHKKAQLGFQQLALMYPKRIKLINANQDVNDVFDDIISELKKENII